MKKFIVLALLAMVMVSCDFRGPLIAEETIKVDNEVMAKRYGEYKWFETSIELKDYLDDEKCDGTIAQMSDIFQIEEPKSDGSIDTYVVEIKSQSRSKRTLEVKHGFWLEDCPLNDEVIKIKFHQAYLRLCAANCPKPHSKKVVLRKAVGPTPVNPRWIFGNQQLNVAVDAVTGEVIAN